MSGSDCTPNGTPWRTTAPDPAESRWWWVYRRNDRRPDDIVAADFRARALWTGAMRLRFGDWPAGWRCAPIPSPAVDVAALRAEVEREASAAVVEECARVCDAIVDENDRASVHPDAHAETRVRYAAKASALRVAAKCIRARLAPRAEPAPTAVDDLRRNRGAGRPAFLAPRPEAPAPDNPLIDAARGRDAPEARAADAPDGVYERGDDGLYRKVRDLAPAGMARRAAASTRGPDEATVALMAEVVKVARPYAVGLPGWVPLREALAALDARVK